MATLKNAPLLHAGTITDTSRRKRYAMVGVGIRQTMFQDAIEVRFPEHAEIVGLCDVNQGRLKLAQSRSRRNGAKVPPIYLASDFSRMLRETRPDTVIVTTVDATHDEYMIRAMESGCDVITEKPMTTTAEKCQRILDAKARTGRNIKVTFNYRYSPMRTQVKELLMSGEIGDVLSVDFRWMLNTLHGADYFRRWHAHKEHSGGLMVHKATHHFDLLNWWLSDVPELVFATGKREFYTPKTARRFGLSGQQERCLTCTEIADCNFYLDLNSREYLKTLYLENEYYDGYLRDRCIWRPEVDIEDTMNVLVTYRSGITLTYSLNAFSPWSGYIAIFNGTLGRLEHTVVERAYMSGDGTVQGGLARGGVTTRTLPLRDSPTEHTPWKSEGPHAGGDKLMMEDLFLPNQPADKYLRASDERGGAASILVGVAANHCFETGLPVKISDLVSGFKAPDLPPGPSRTGPLPMPPPIENINT